MHRWTEDFTFLLLFFSLLFFSFHRSVASTVDGYISTVETTGERDRERERERGRRDKDKK